VSLFGGTEGGQISGCFSYILWCRVLFNDKHHLRYIGYCMLFIFSWCSNCYFAHVKFNEGKEI